MKNINELIGKVHCADCLELLKEIPDESVDAIITDPPYQLSYVDRWGKTDWSKEKYKQKELDNGGSVYTRSIKGFMGKKWDVLPSVEIWKESLRVMKSGAFAFILCTPRQDSLIEMLIRLREAGFCISFSSIYWTYASGFPKAGNIGKMYGKKFENKREVIGINKDGGMSIENGMVFRDDNWKPKIRDLEITKGSSELEGCYTGFQPKPAVEIIIVAMKPLTEKTYLAQAIKNKKGVTWLDDCRIPFQKGDEPIGGFGNMDIGIGKPMEHQNYRRPDSIISKNPHTLSKGTDAYDVNCYGKYNPPKIPINYMDSKGRFPANVLVEDDILNDENLEKGNGHWSKTKTTGFGEFGNGKSEYFGVGEKDLSLGSKSRYFSLDAWWDKKIKELPENVQKVFPFLFCPKASKSEKNNGLENSDIKEKSVREEEGNPENWDLSEGKVRQRMVTPPPKNFHPTCKPIKLMSWLITLGSRENDIILDPFLGSGTTAVSCEMLNRKWIGIDKEEEYYKISNARINKLKEQTKL